MPENNGHTNGYRERLPWLYVGERKGAASWTGPGEFAAAGQGTLTPEATPDPAGIRPQPRQLINAPSRQPNRPQRPMPGAGGQVTPPHEELPEPAQRGQLRQWLATHPSGPDQALLLHLFGHKDSLHEHHPEDMAALKEHLGGATPQQLLRIMHGLNSEGIFDPARHELMHEMLGQHDEGPEVPLEGRNVDQAWVFHDDGRLSDRERSRLENSLRRLPRVKGTGNTFLLPKGLDALKVFGHNSGARRAGPEEIREVQDLARQEELANQPTSPGGVTAMPPDTGKWKWSNRLLHRFYNRPLPTKEQLNDPKTVWRSIQGENATIARGGAMWKVNTPDGQQFIAKKARLDAPWESQIEEATAGALRMLGIPAPQSKVMDTPGGKVLVQSYVPGKELYYATANDLARIRKANPPKKLARVLFGSWLMGLDDRHPGNIAFTPDGLLVQLDFGSSLFPTYGHRRDTLLEHNLVSNFEEVPREAMEEAARLRKPILNYVMKTVASLEPSYVNRVEQQLNLNFDHVEQMLRSGQRVLLGDLPKLGGTKKERYEREFPERHSMGGGTGAALPHAPLIRLASGSTHVPAHYATPSNLLTHTLDPHSAHNLAMTAGAQAILTGKPAQHVHNAAWPHGVNPNDPGSHRRAETAYMGVHAEPSGHFYIGHGQGVPGASREQILSHFIFPEMSPEGFGANDRVEIHDHPELRAFLGAVHDAGSRDKDPGPFHMLTDFLTEHGHPASEGVARARDFPEVVSALAADPNPITDAEMNAAGLYGIDWRKNLQSVPTRTPAEQHIFRRMVGLGYPMYGGSGTGTIQPLLRRERFAREGKAERYDHLHPTAEKVHDAAQAVHLSPSDKQREANNFRQGHIRLFGMDITIETAKGQTRRKKNKDGKEWSREMHAHYGRIRKTTAADGEHLDCFIGDHPQSELVVVIEQLKESGRHDEYKCILGCTSLAEAKKLYLAHYPKGWKVGQVRPMTVPQFREWAFSDQAKKAWKHARNDASPSTSVVVESPGSERTRAAGTAGSERPTQVRGQPVSKSTDSTQSTPERYAETGQLQGPLVGVQHHGTFQAADGEDYHFSPSRSTHPIESIRLRLQAAQTAAHAFATGLHEASAIHRLPAGESGTRVPVGHGVTFVASPEGKVIARGAALHPSDWPTPPREDDIADLTGPQWASRILRGEPLREQFRQKADSRLAQIIREAEQYGPAPRFQEIPEGGQGHQLHAQVHIHPDPHFREFLKNAVLGGPAEAGILADYLEERGREKEALAIREGANIKHHGPAVAGAIAEEIPGETNTAQSSRPFPPVTGEKQNAIEHEMARIGVEGTNVYPDPDLPAGWVRVSDDYTSTYGHADQILNALRNVRYNPNQHDHPGEAFWEGMHTFPDRVHPEHFRNTARLTDHVTQSGEHRVFSIHSNGGVQYRVMPNDPQLLSQRQTYDHSPTFDTPEEAIQWAEEYEQPDEDDQ